MKLLFFFAFTISLIQLSTSAIGATIHVPVEYSTIQAAINAAVNGDTVLVADNTYKGIGNKELDFGGKEITVQSENGPDNCIIDAENNGRGFYLHSGETLNSIISGFTITNGNPANGHGGGILIRNASALTIINCIIKNNNATYAGGGISADFGATMVSISKSTIYGNLTDGSGGGVYSAGGSVDVSECIIENNGCSGGLGGGIHFIGANLNIIRSIIRGNTRDGGGGEGIFCAGVLVNQQIVNAFVTIVNSLLYNNYRDENAIGTAITFMHRTGDNLSILNCTIASNGYGLHLCLQTDGSPSDAYPIIKNSIIWNNNWGAIRNDAGTLLAGITYSDIQGGYSGVGNIDANPLFKDQVNGNYQLHPKSPCSNTGTSEGAPSDDLIGTERPQKEKFDMGAYEDDGSYFFGEGALMLLLDE